MSNTIRIKTTPNGGDKYLKLKLEQDFDFIEILSLQITQEDAYRKFCSDYGVIVGRVVINSGFGVPNAKVSVFIPLDDVDKNDPLIKGLYPFEVVSDKDDNGIRYNLLPKMSETDNNCYTPIGTFPTKREVLDNDTMLNVYCKYYKFTTTTNRAGDFMLFGVPLGTYTVHVDADISDIGIASQRPYDLISQGTPQKMFYSPTKFKGGTNLDKLIQVKTVNAGVNVQPFWGDKDNCEIGISRLDLDLNYSITPSAIFMGSIYGDQHKHSINKQCRPRKKVGLMCEQVTGPGSINMIRKTITNDIEAYDIEGGRLIDDDGTWAYQIPMNLDYMITAEDGSMILSQDSNKGIPTRARVRFNIGMDETGSEGRLRTRARYLVPNNPKTTNEIDYHFDSNTKDTSFKDLYWNKIYSVSNFISRFQRDNEPAPVRARAITGMKDVDACAGDKTPYPYNRVNTESNPIFFIICLIIKIIGFLIYVMNIFMIPFINVIISVINSIVGAIVSTINGIIDAINSLGFSLHKISFQQIPYIACISVACPDDDPSYFAPGCKNGGIDSGHGFNAATPRPDYYEDDNFGHSGFGNDAGLSDCIAFEMAKTLNMFQFDFYNDWVNGTLFGYLLKYKKNRTKREVFCEHDCLDFTNDINYTGIDGNQNGVPDNNCHNNILLDTCFDNSGNSDCQYENRSGNTIRDGLIKKVKDEFFYAATTHDLNYKLFATDIISLGSVFECDWQGIPKIQELLIPTTYKMPPDIQELSDDKTQMEVCGIVDVGGTTSGEFFHVNCLGLHVNHTQCLNLRHICEMGVDIDQAVEDPNTGVIVKVSDCIIGVDDIDDNKGKWFRDVFTALNTATTTTTTFEIGNGLSTEFNNGNCDFYDITSSAPSPCNSLVPTNGENYVDFRGITNTNAYSQSNHSYYFYFGVLPGKTAIEKLNQRFFTPCTPILRDDLIIEGAATVSSGSTGTIIFTFIGGHGPYTYTIIGPNSYYISGSTNSNPPTTVLTGLDAGSYVISGFDVLGTPVTHTLVVSPPLPLYCSVSATRGPATSTSNDGEITISAIGGGQPPYSWSITDYLGVPVGTPSSGTGPTIIGGLAADNTFGYIVTINDSASGSCITSGITLSGPTVMHVNASVVDMICYDSNDGEIHIGITGGTPPYMITTSGPAGYSSPSNNLLGLSAGVYTTTVIDSLSSTTVANSTVSSLNPQLLIDTPNHVNIARQCSPTQYMIPFFIIAGLAGGSTAYVEYDIDNSGVWTAITFTYVNSTTPLILTIPSTSISTRVNIRFSNTLAHTCYSNIITVNKSDMTLPTSALSGNISTTNPSTGVYVHTITSSGGVGSVSASPYNIGVITNSIPIITTTITDSNGCSIIVTG